MTASRPSPALWAGRALSGLFVIALLADGGVALFAPELMKASMTETGMPLPLLPVIGAISLVCAVVYAIPRTRVLGAILATGFLGGAICTHFRLGGFGAPPQIVSFLLGVLAWGGLYLTDSRVRALIPLVRRRP